MRAIRQAVREGVITKSQARNCMGLFLAITEFASDMGFGSEWSVRNFPHRIKGYACMGIDLVRETLKIMKQLELITYDQTRDGENQFGDFKFEIHTPRLGNSPNREVPGPGKSSTCRITNNDLEESLEDVENKNLSAAPTRSKKSQAERERIEFLGTDPVKGYGFRVANPVTFGLGVGENWFTADQLYELTCEEASAGSMTLVRMLHAIYETKPLWDQFAAHAKASNFSTYSFCGLVLKTMERLAQDLKLSIAATFWAICNSYHLQKAPYASNFKPGNTHQFRNFYMTWFFGKKSHAEKVCVLERALLEYLSEGREQERQAQEADIDAKALAMMEEIMGEEADTDGGKWVN